MRNAARTRTTVSIGIIAFFGLMITVTAATGLASGYYEVIGIGLVWTGILMTVFFALGLARWIPSSRGDGDCLQGGRTCYCEAYAPGLIKQPINTWSDLSFIASGMLILSIIGSSNAASALPSNPMAALTAFSIAYAMIVIFMGPASMFLHASLKNWGGFFDAYSIALWVLFSAVYTLGRIIGVDMIDAGWIVGVFILFALVAGAVGLVSWFYPRSREWFSIVLGAGWGIFELVVLITQPGGVQREGLWLAAALATLAVAIVLWWLSDTGRPLCSPSSWAQGHAAWHILAAAVTFLTYMYFRSEVVV